MRKCTIALILCLLAVAAYSGDVASFVSLGFTKDASVYAFGQHGVTDASFASYSDVYYVDVAKNTFLPSGKFSAGPQASKGGHDSAVQFHELKQKAAAKMKNTLIDEQNQGRPLYVQAAEEGRLKKIEFRDFETGRHFDVTMHTLTDGTLSRVASSFYLLVRVTSSDGTVQSHTVGLPSYSRKGVKDYLIKRVITDTTGSSVVFVIEKEMYDTKGSSIRYMVETLTL
ncbi:MAG: DUF2259 domain-containing protein [Spirochaetales bacterium]|nr:DUF2259 domain-containing protein [Spirochaetales bacterium]HNQ96569.1 DUF2259 domain-containing protein [Treponemataceae bacterium]